MPRRKIVISALAVVIVLLGGVWALRWFSPGFVDRRPALVEMPPLSPVTRDSRMVLPAVIALSAIRDMMERAPREASGKLEIPPGPFGGMPGPYGGAKGPDFTWSFSRGTFALSGGPDGLFLSTALSGALRATGQFGPPGPGFGPPGFPRPPGGYGPPPGFGGPGSLFGGRDQQQSQQQSKTQNEQTEQRIEISGNVELTARPSLLPDWRLHPNLAASVTIGQASADIMGMKFSLSEEMKPVVERTVNEQVASLQERMADSPLIEQAARQEWSKMCRSVSLGAVGAGMPNLWLEVRPTRAFAAQPSIDRSSVTLTFGVQAETRIVGQETKPNCSFPTQLELVPQMERGHVNIGVPIDIPFTEINRLVEAQLLRKTFPLDKGGAFTATVRGVNVAASGGRLLISLRVKANEHKTWFGLGAEATVHVWGRPALDRRQQTLQIEDVSLDVESEAAFGVLGAAARAALPFLEKAVTENASIDLKPIAENARRSIGSAIAEFQRSTRGVRVDADVTDLRLGSIEFDSKTLRVIAEADGSVRIAITELPREQAR
jgi:hypothetical protein